MRINTYLLGGNGKGGLPLLSCASKYQLPFLKQRQMECSRRENCLTHPTSDKDSVDGPGDRARGTRICTGRALPTELAFLTPSK
ncbi:hypothetical protein DPMN_161365 [Dreissena polymorpha]|uniref:Uncharacterized protein n=1 Tax=Dreissena polymorpha TaxID=45954 RepID=A0A9D4ISM0_DREPO|nr:hypothetical protein DPMN_161365 [Dreissena polymorpha]